MPCTLISGLNDCYEISGDMVPSWLGKPLQRISRRRGCCRMLLTAPVLSSFLFYLVHRLQYVGLHVSPLGFSTYPHGQLQLVLGLFSSAHTLTVAPLASHILSSFTSTIFFDPHVNTTHRYAFHLCQFHCPSRSPRVPLLRHSNPDLYYKAFRHTSLFRKRNWQHDSWRSCQWRCLRSRR
jgi:hypothetical protein